MRKTTILIIFSLIMVCLTTTSCLCEKQKEITDNVSIIGTIKSIDSLESTTTIYLEDGREYTVETNSWINQLMPMQAYEIFINGMHYKRIPKIVDVHVLYLKD